MPSRNTIQIYLKTIVAIAILLAASQATEARGGSRLRRKRVIKSLCAQTAYPTLCRPLVKGPNPRRATHNTIRALEAKTKLAIAASARHKNGNPTVAVCYAKLMDASFNLGNARKSIRKRNVMSLKMSLTAAVSDYGACVNGFIDSRQVNTVQNAVDELRKMGTNCLLLATLIR